MRDSVKSPTSRSTFALIGALIALVGALALCVDRFHNGDFYLSLGSGRFIAEHGFAAHDPFATIAHGGTWLNQQWLSELAFFRVSQLVGPTGLTVLYAILLAAPLALLLWLCRSKGWPMLVAVTGFYFPGVLAVVNPRAAGFTVLIFSMLVTLLVAVWWERSGAKPGERRLWWGTLAILGLFALWANLHGGFVAGLLLLGLVTIGLAIDHWRGIPDAVPLRTVAGLGVIAVLAAVIVTVATPLGGAIWSYMLSFQNQAIAIASTEWQSAFSSPVALVYLILAAAFAGWMWVRSPGPRRATTLLVTAGFLVFAGYSLRNIIFIGPVLALQVAWTAPNRRPTSLRLPVALAGSAAAAAALVWAAILGPARDDPTLAFPIADYAIAHPPENGRIVTYAGVGSYINWRSPATPVVLNGWLEHYTPQELRDNYGVLRASSDLPAALRRIQAGAVITHGPSSIQQLQAAGFEPVYSTPDGTYLVRRAKPDSGSGR